jgi:hypothetical protein
VALSFGPADDNQPLAEAIALGPVIELCNRCGFDIPVDAGACPQCGPEDTAAPPLAARQVAGVALPTRSVRRLPRTRPRRAPEPRAVPPAVGARTAFAYTWLLVVVALVGALLARLARLDRYVSSLPQGTAEWLEDLTVMATLGSVIGLLIGLVAMAVWCIRRVVIEVERRQRDTIVL